MPDYIGNIAVPEIMPSGVFPLTPDYPLEVRRDHEVVVHQFGSGNAKIEQRFLLGTGVRRFTIRKQWLRDAERIALRNFWESKYGPFGAFTFNAPNDDGVGTTPFICRFANEPLSWEMVADWACSLGVTLIEIPQSSPSYPLNQTVNRFPPAALQTALLSQVQEIIPLVRIQPLQPGYPAIRVSDRRCTIGGQLYQARLVEFDGISQSIGNESDEAQFTFGNADRVMRDLANDVDLFRAGIAFSLFHVGTAVKLDLWKGNIVNWTCDAGPEFRVTAADGPGAPGDVVPSGEFHLQRAYPGVPEGQATFGTLRCTHLAGIRFYKLDQKTFTFSVRKGFFRTPGLPARIEAKLPSACIVAALAGVANHFGYGPFTVFPLSRHNEPFMPGLRTCNGGAYTFQVPGPLTVQENVVIPMKVQDAASIRCVYAYLQRGTLDGQSAYLVKISRDGGTTWEPLEYMGIAQALPDAYKTTYDFLANNEGYGLPATRRLPYADYGLVLISPVTAGPDPQTLQTASYGANRLGLVAGGLVFLDPGGANEEYVRVISVDPDNQRFDAIVTKNHAVGERIRPTIWPTPVLNEGDDLAFDILAVASPDPGSDLTVVIQT